MKTKCINGQKFAAISHMIARAEWLRANRESQVIAGLEQFRTAKPALFTRRTPLEAIRWRITDAAHTMRSWHAFGEPSEYGKAVCARLREEIICLARIKRALESDPPDHSTRALPGEARGLAGQQRQARTKRVPRYKRQTENMTTNEYTEQAKAFLAKHAIKFRARLSDSKVAPWGDDAPASRWGTANALQTDAIQKVRHHYRVTLSRATTPVVMPSRLTFDFWGSIADAKKGRKTVTPYDVLACISGDVNCPETFADFCGEFGYEQDSIKSLQLFRRCAAFGKRLRAFFTPEERGDLAEIN